MSQSSIENTLDVIEVPPELRGLSDEEIIKISEKPLREVSGKRKNGAKRPGKKVRLALKMQKELEEIKKTAAEIFEKQLDQDIRDINFFSVKEKKDMLAKAYSKASDSYSIYDVISKKELNSHQKDDYLIASSTEASKTATSAGRVLKASFGSIAKRILVKK